MSGGLAALGGRDAVRAALARAGKGGAYGADALCVESEGTEVRARAAEVDSVSQARERTLGLRVFVRGGGGLRSAVVSTSDLAPDAVDRLADDALALAASTAEDPCAGLPHEPLAEDVPDLALFAPEDRDVPVDARIDEAIRAERAARALDPRIANSEGSEASGDVSRIVYASSAGFEGAYEAATHGLASSPVASAEGELQTESWVSVARCRSDLESPESVGERAAARALERLGARRVATCEVPVIFDPLAARGLLANLVSCLSGYAVYRRSSFLADRLGEALASERVTVIDDGRLPGGLGSKPFDGEGRPTGRTRVVERGRLESFLLDSYSGRKLGRPSTGHAARSPGSAPGVGPTNLWIEPGDATLEELVADTPRGLLVTSLFGHGFDPVTGDLSRGAAGVWIEEGRRTHPVEEVTVAGNLRDMLARVDGVGSEVLWVGRIAAPALRVARMTVAGT